jgi:hypothetical protein
MQALLADPRVRGAARQAGLASIKFLGNARARRANQGRWYFGRRLGIPPQRRRQGGQNRGGFQLVSTTQTSAPVARASRMSTNPASQTYNASGVDWLVDVANNLVGTAPYVESYTINPAEPSSFTRLANIAAQYQKYTFVSLSLIYTNSCPTTQKGTLYVAPLRDPTQKLPLTVAEIRGLSGCKSCSVHDPMTITVNKAQLSAALNGFYCEAPDGVAPSEDNALRSCGRICTLLDGVGKTDGVVGTLTLRYNFLLSDPKTTVEGAALAGGFLFPGFTGNLDWTIASNSYGKPALTILDDDRLVKRHTGPVLVVVHTTCSTNPTYVMSLDGVVLAEKDQFQHNASPNWTTRWWLPPGRQTITLTSGTTAIVGALMESYSTGSIY